EKPFWVALQKFQREGGESPKSEAGSERRHFAGLCGANDLSRQNAGAPSLLQSAKSSGAGVSPALPPSITHHAPAHSKAALFLRQFEGWRGLARQGSLSHCLEPVLTETHYEALLLAEPRGEERVPNGRRL